MNRYDPRSLIVLVLLTLCCSAQNLSEVQRQITEAMKAEGKKTYSFAITRSKHLLFKPVVVVLPPGDKDNEELLSIDHISVYQPGEAAPMQELRECPADDPPPAGAPLLVSEDLNFDGYSDLLLLQNSGATGNNFYCVWLFDPANGRFRFRDDWELGTHKIDPARQSISVVAVGGMAGQLHTIQTFKVINDHPVLIMEEDQEWDDAQCAFKRTLREKVGNELKVIKVEYVKDDQGWCEKK